MFPIFPSLLAFDLIKLREQVTAIASLGVEGFHLDIMDGQYVPNLTFGASLARAVSTLTDLPITAHLMTYTPENLFSELYDSGVTKVYIHPESTPHINRVLNLALDAGLIPAVAINPGTPLCAIDPILDIIKGVLVMTVNPGFGGQRILSNSIGRIKNCAELLSNYPEIELIADGGIDTTNIRNLKFAGLSAAVIGTAIFKGEDTAATIKELISI